MGVSRSSLPRLLGRYAIYDQIAAGGMASVHIGRLIGAVGFSRTVAIKVMQPQFAEDREFVSMFVDEARVAARISHPNVIPTLDVVAENGELLLVMDYVHGESLARLIKTAAQRQQRIPPAMVATIMAGVLHGLHAAHEAKSETGGSLDLVHRDVSPQNVLVGLDGVARVLDFGVAKAIGRLQNTRTGQLKGKLAYMAPEQVSGTVSRATDIYAAAVVTWEALTGRRLFKGQNEVEVLHAVLRGCTEPPSHYVPGLPPALDELTMRGLDGNPQHRFPTAREMARAFEDAVPLVSATRIGEWVESMAHDSLQERSRRVAEIESDSPGRNLPMPAAIARDEESARSSAAALRAPLPAAGRPAQGTGRYQAVAPPVRAPAPSFHEPDEDATIVTDPSALTQMSAGSVSTSGAMPMPARPRGSVPVAVWGALMGLVAAGVIGAAWTLGRASNSPRGAAAVAAPPPSIKPEPAHPAAGDSHPPPMDRPVTFPEPASPSASASVKAAPSARK